MSVGGTNGAGWSSEFTTVECRDLQATAMCVDSTGQRALLAGRRILATVSLDQLDTGQPAQLSKHPRTGKYDIGAAEWNPTLNRAHQAALSTNQRVELLDMGGAGGVPTITHTLHAHSRAVTDLNWHRTDPYTLATCSADTFTHVWDVRDPRRPALSFTAVAEATQVRWNPIRSHILATAHDGDVKIWDQRRGTQPTHYLAAHLAKIHGVQWSPHAENELVTCSQDGTVKLWDVQQPRRAVHCLTTAQPVWRVRYTPFGRGLVTVVLPAACAQLRRTQHDHSLLLWNMHSRTQPQHTFVGHEDVVLEFDWRPQVVGATDHQLVTWAKDGTLRVWRVDPYLQKLCGHTADTQAEQRSPHDEPEPTQANQPHTLQQEFSLLNLNIPGVEVVEMDANARSCTLSVSNSGGGRHILVHALFPQQYPLNSPPKFTVTPDTQSGELVRALASTARDRVNRNRTCLEPCLRRLAQTLDALPPSVHTPQDKAYYEPPYGSYNDAYIPFPRTCGARFCSVNTLVSFARPPNACRRTSNKEHPSTPRALSALATGHMAGDVSISSFYYQDRVS